MTPEELLARARDCEHKARQVADPVIQEMYRKLARHWAELAAKLTDDDVR